jgi:hypothetical protein
MPNQTMMEDQDDGFISPKIHRKKKNDSAETTAAAGTAIARKKHHQWRNTNSTTTSTMTTTSRFGQQQWAKPSIAVKPTTPSTATENSTLRISAKVTSKDSLPESTSSFDAQRRGVTSNAMLGICNMNMDSTDADKATTTMTITTTTTESMWPQPSLASLLEDYGTYDPNWMKVEPTNMVDHDDEEGGTEHPKSDTLESGGNALLSGPVNNIADSVMENPTNDQYEPSTEDETVNGINRLQIQGHAPIHVELVSFGYRYGIPSEIRYYSTGNCYTQPLSPFDTRTTLAPLPNYLLHLDGKSGLTKNAMLRWTPISEPHHHKQDKSSLSKSRTVNSSTGSTNYMNVRDYIHEYILPPVKESIIAAIDIGQHGYVSPITISIYMGSDNGKHRSVVTAELTAVALRKLFRTNPHNQFQCPISVGCRHRDIMNTALSSSGSSSHHRNVASKKQKALEEEED